MMLNLLRNLIKSKFKKTYMPYMFQKCNKKTIRATNIFLRLPLSGTLTIFLFLL